MLTPLKFVLPTRRELPWSGGESTVTPSNQQIMDAIQAIEKRLKRMESRLCQLMLDQGSPIHPENTNAG